MLLVPEADLAALCSYVPRCFTGLDRRETMPVLAVDIDNETHVTRKWSHLYVILTDLRICEFGIVGQQFSGSFTVDGVDGFGLFDATISKVDRVRNRIMAQFDHVSMIGTQLLAKSKQQHITTGPDEWPLMTVSLACPMFDWSPSGLALAESPARFAVGQQISGTILDDRAQQTGAFTGVAARLTSDPDVVELRVLTMTSQCHDLLESATREQSGRRS